MAYPVTETCHDCGVEYPYPVSHHHVDEECQANQKADRSELLATLGIDFDATEAEVLEEIRNNIFRGPLSTLGAKGAGEIANAVWRKALEG